MSYKVDTVNAYKIILKSIKQNYGWIMDRFALYFSSILLKGYIDTLEEKIHRNLSSSSPSLIFLEQHFPPIS